MNTKPIPDHNSQVAPLSGLEKLALRLQKLPRGKFVSVTMLIADDGDALVWTVTELGKPEGLRSTNQAEKRVD